MNAVRKHRLYRIIATIVAFAAWLVLSNHCAFTELMAAQTNLPAAQESCCHHKPSSDEKPACPAMPQGCCKSLKVALPDAKSIPKVAVAEFLPLMVAWAEVFTRALPGQCDESAPLLQPPDSPSFAELVLNRSLLSHAPPASA